MRLFLFLAFKQLRPKFPKLPQPQPTRLTSLSAFQDASRCCQGYHALHGNQKLLFTGSITAARNEPNSARESGMNTRYLGCFRRFCGALCSFASDLHCPSLNIVPSDNQKNCIPYRMTALSGRIGRGENERLLLITRISLHLLCWCSPYCVSLLFVRMDNLANF